MGKKLSTYVKENSITYRTAWNMAKKGLLKTETLPTGTMLVEEIKEKDKHL